MAWNGKDLTLAFARFALGCTALLHGIADTFGIWGGPRHGLTTADMAAQAAVSPDTITRVVSIGLIVIGLLLVLGWATRVVGLVLLAMVVWTGVANSRFGAWFESSHGCEGLVALAALCLVVAAHGPGAFKVELKGKKQ